VELTELNEKIAAKGTKEAIEKAKADLASGKLSVFDTKSFTVGGKHLTEYLADVIDKGDFQPETNVIVNGVFVESGEQFRSAPYFDMLIDGIKKYE
ncbi:MAG: BMP family ABC transporter substrate-binding protein, partial [Spirochaetia bacterium]|nr:BMP family ABC transporter substrate-binding protein [Spirochaetia bacterium]